MKTRVDEWTRTFKSMASEWTEIVGRSSSDPAAYEDQFAVLAAEQAALRTSGRWVSGPADLLAVIGKAHDELVHSRIVAWLLTPAARHGFGDRFLRSFLDAAWPGEEIQLDGPVNAELEVERTGFDERTGAPMSARADIVLRLPDCVVVIENKVWASEQPAQCERLYWAFANEGGVVRYLFLTPAGRPPITATSADARNAWRTLDYGALRRLLDTLLGGRDGPDIMSSTAHQYAMTLRTWGVR